MNKLIFIIVTCLLLGSVVLVIHSNALAQSTTSSALDALSQVALGKIDKALKDKSTDAGTKEKLNKVAKALRKGTLVKGSSSGIVKGDFNGDGYADLAIGIPHEGTFGVIDSGAVIVIYGSVTGLGRSDNGADTPKIPTQFWTQNSAGIPGAVEAHDEFGSALASGDFNGDGFSDLAIGIPQESITIPFNGTNLVFANSGAVLVIYGSAHGLTATDPNVHPPQSFDFSIFGPTFSAGTQIKGNERLGTALAWGDFNGDGVGDLAIGAPGRNVTTVNANPRITVPGAGEVWILFGSKPVVTCRGCGINPASGGLTRTGMPASNVAATTLPEEFINAVEFINFLGSCGVGQPDCGLGTAAQGAGFGTVLAAGDFNGDGKTDLAAGLPNFGFGGNLPGNIKNAGAVVVFSADQIDGGFALGPGSSSRVALNGAVLTELSGQIPTANAGDNYGAALAVGDFNGDGRSDLAIGIPNRTVGVNTHAGAVHVRYGHVGTSSGDFLGANSLPLSASQNWTQNALFPANHPFDRSESGEFFGAALAAGDFNGDGRADLAIGVPLEDVLVSSGAQNIVMAGEVDVVYGSAGVGLSIGSHNAEVWTKGRGNGALQTLHGSPHAGDLFGFSLTAWNFGDPSFFVGTGNRNQADLAIGAPFEDLFQVSGVSAGTLVANAGAVNVIYGSPGPRTSLTSNDGLTQQGNQLWTAASPNVNIGLQQDANFGFTLY